MVEKSNEVGGYAREENGGRRDGRYIPAQFTSEEGEGRELYACHRREAVFARLLAVCQDLHTGG